MYGEIYSPLYASSGTEYAVSSGFSDLSFNDYDLQNGSVNIIGHDFESPGVIQYVSKDRGLTDGAVFVDKKTRLRSMTVVGYLIAASREAVELLADQFKGEIDQMQGVLRYKSRGSNYREIVATCTSVDMKRQAYHVTKIPFTITFTANDPFWSAIVWDSKSISWLSSATYIDTLDNIWSAEMALRGYIFLKTGNTGVTSISFNNNGRTLTIPGTFVDDDVIFIDFKRSRVYLNGVKTEYSGTFPTFPRWSNTFMVTINGSARSYNLMLLSNYKYK